MTCLQRPFFPFSFCFCFPPLLMFQKFMAFLLSFLQYFLFFFGGFSACAQVPYAPSPVKCATASQEKPPAQEPVSPPTATAVTTASSDSGHEHDCLLVTGIGDKVLILRRNQFTVPTTRRAGPDRNLTSLVFLTYHSPPPLQ